MIELLVRVGAWKRIQLLRVMVAFDEIRTWAKTNCTLSAVMI